MRLQLARWMASFLATAIAIIITETTLAQPKDENKKGALTWIDPDTELADKETSSLIEIGQIYDLVMSDEFNKNNRSFADGHDPVWTALHRSDDARAGKRMGALQYYNDKHVTTMNGTCRITTTNEDTTWKGLNPFTNEYVTMEKNYRSGMIQSWNKFCFTGGIVEISVKLPGEFDKAGLWPAFWLMGNLGRATFEGSTNLIWPWSYNKCNRKLQTAQEISACKSVNHFDLHGHVGRGSTEIDILEAMAGWADPQKGHKVGLPNVGTTLQIAPGIEKKRPYPGDPPGPDEIWYDGMEYGNTTDPNWAFYGTLLGETSVYEPAYRGKHQIYQADAISAVTKLNQTHFDDFHTFRLEWVPGPGGRLSWHLDDEFLFSIDGATFENTTGAQIPMEPSYLIINTAVSSTWGFPQTCPDDCTCDCYDCKRAECACAVPNGFCSLLPATFEIDWVRVYQKRGDKDQYLGCDPERMPTRKFIESRKFKYSMPTRKEPLYSIVTGGAGCASSKDCGGGDTKLGRCIKGFCKCEDRWVGPTCLSPRIIDETASLVEEIRIKGFYLGLDSGVPLFLATLILLFVVSAIVLTNNRIAARKLRNNKID